MRIVTMDPASCVACRNCEYACAFRQSGGLRAARSHIRVNFYPEERVCIPLTCMHCDEAWCLEVCPAAAISRDPGTGAVVIDADRCAGCKMCLLACPYGQHPLRRREPGVSRKCDLCGGRPAVRALLHLRGAASSWRPTRPSTFRREVLDARLRRSLSLDRERRRCRSRTGDLADALPHVRRPLRHRRAPGGRPHRRHPRQQGAPLEPRPAVRQGAGGGGHGLPPGPAPRAAEAHRRRLAGDPPGAGARRDRRAPRGDQASSTARAAVGVWKGEAIGFGQQEDLARRFVHAIGSPNYLSNDSHVLRGRYFGYKLVRRGLARRRPRERPAAWSCGARTRRTRTPT